MMHLIDMRQRFRTSATGCRSTWMRRAEQHQERLLRTRRRGYCLDTTLLRNYAQWYVDGMQAPESYANPAAFMACTKGVRNAGIQRARTADLEHLGSDLCGAVCDNHPGVPQSLDLRRRGTYTRA